VTDPQNPPTPQGYKLLPDSAVTPEMSQWSITILFDQVTYPMFSSALRVCAGNVTILARVEWHPPDAQNPAEHRGVTLYGLVSPPGVPAEGIDVSAYQPTVDWQHVLASGVSFAFIKATEGTGIVDRSFASHWLGAKAAGLLRGPYHFFRPQQDAAAQARAFLAQLTSDPGELPPVIDVELSDRVSGGQIQDGVSVFVDAIRQALGHVIVYTMPGFWNTLPARPDITAKSDLWVAHWGVHSPMSCFGYSRWTFWQYTNLATIPGIPGTGMDANRFNGTIDDLRAYSRAYVASRGGAAPPVPQPRPNPDLTTILGVQQALNYLGADPKLKEDGVLGPKTTAAIIAFQQRVGLVPDGVVGPKTRAAIEVAIARHP
jgi:lysozyme